MYRQCTFSASTEVWEAASFSAFSKSLKVSQSFIERTSPLSADGGARHFRVQTKDASNTQRLKAKNSQGFAQAFA